MHNPTLQMGHQVLGLLGYTLQCFLEYFSTKFWPRFLSLAGTAAFPFHDLFLGFMMLGGNCFFSLDVFRQWVVMRRVKAKKSILSSGLTNLKTLNAALLSTSIVFMQCGQYHFFHLTSIRQTLTWASRLSTPPICLLYSVMQLGRLIFM